MERPGFTRTRQPVAAAAGGRAAGRGSWRDRRARRWLAARSRRPGRSPPGAAAGRLTPWPDARPPRPRPGPSPGASSSSRRGWAPASARSSRDRGLGWRARAVRAPRGGSGAAIVPAQRPVPRSWYAGAPRQRNRGRVRLGVDGLGLVRGTAGQYRWRSCGGYFPRCTHGASQFRRTHLARAASVPPPLDGGGLEVCSPAPASNEGSASPLNRGKGTIR